MLPWKAFFLSLLVLGSLMAISAPSWMTAWMGLEMNMMAFITLAMNEKSPRNSEATLKYFLTQALASAVLISSAFIMSIMSWSMSNLNILISLIMLSLLLKLGSAPFHFWIPQVVEGLTWWNTLIVLIWQKVAPFILLLSCFESKFSKMILITTITLSTGLGAIMGLSQTSIRKILSYSSINHLGWMMMGLICKFNVWFFYFVLYSFMLFLLVSNLKTFNMSSLSSISGSLSTSQKLSIMISLLSFGGLPPLLGFGPKWMIILETINMSSVLALIMVMMSLITLYFYLRVSFSYMLLKVHFFANSMTKKSNLEYMTIISNSFGLLFTSSLFLW